MPAYCRRRFSRPGLPLSGSWRWIPRESLRLPQNTMTGKGGSHETDSPTAWNTSCLHSEEGKWRLGEPGPQRQAGIPTPPMDRGSSSSGKHLAVRWGSLACPPHSGCRDQVWHPWNMPKQVWSSAVTWLPFSKTVVTGMPGAHESQKMA